MDAALPAAEEVRGRLALRIERLEIPLHLFGRPRELVVLVAEHVQRIRVALQLGPARTAEERGAVAAVVEPVAGLPGLEAGRPGRDLLDHVARDVVRRGPFVRERRVMEPRSLPVGDAPGTERIVQLVLRGDRARVDPPAGAATPDAHRVRLLDRPGRHRIRVIHELRERVAHRAAR
jgi:hypothetical protein